MQRHDQNNGDRAVGQEVGHIEPHAGQQPQRAGTLVAEHRKPAERLRPGRDHIGDDDQH